MEDLARASGRRLAELIRGGVVSAEEVARATLDRIQKVDPAINAFISVDELGALEAARAIDSARSRGVQLSPLAGVPVAIKDNMCTRGVATTAGSKMLADFIPPYDATVVQWMRDAGLVIIGKTNMDEFAMGSSTETSFFGPTKNPWNTSKVPGGTSGGSAASVAAREVPFALGSDTGGSIRQPAAFCGVVGLKPTYGRVSRFGLIAYVSSFDQIGILSRDVADCAALLEVIAGYDPKDSTSIAEPVPAYSSLLETPPLRLRVGIPREYLGGQLDPGVRQAIDDAIRVLRSLDIDCEETSLSTADYAIPAYYVIATSEASANLARYDGVKYGFRSSSGSSMWEIMEHTRGEGFGDEVKRRILLGTFALSAGYYDAYYVKAQKIRTLIRRDYERAFESFDVLLMPVSPVGPWDIGEKVSDPLSMYMADLHTVTANLAGVPALTLPMRLDSAGLPVGIQFQGPALAEGLLLQVARLLEQARGPLPEPSLAIA